MNRNRRLRRYRTENGMDSITPSTLEGDEFHDWIATHLNYRHEWGSLFTREHIHRTADSLYGLIELLEDQLNQHLGSSSKDWENRTKSMLFMAQGRARQIERYFEFRDLNSWKGPLHELVGYIVDDGTDAQVDRLSTIKIPYADMSLGEWYDRRIEKREETAALLASEGAAGYWRPKEVAA